ncbi:MAG: MmcB family DNA repair protein [Hyphomicrobiaceae bacterium]|nr:MmcB family DNA repair protein [Hyphomicrobiaceae bacterium]
MTKRQSNDNNPQAPETTPDRVRLAAALADGRQSEAALAIHRGVGRLLRAHGLAHLSEMSLANGRRADVVALSTSGDIWIVEIKSSVLDFRSDQKWPEYRDYCDQYLFAVAPDFPATLIPDDAGLIVADRYGGEIIRPGPSHRLQPARRRAMLLAFARSAALRLACAADPEVEAQGQID